MDAMEADFTGEGKENRDRYLIIAGGDGSLPTTVGMLRTRPVIEDALRQKLMAIICLPFGTGCDTAQVFGWGYAPRDEYWYDRLESLIEDVVTGHGDLLSLWRVII